MDFFDRIGNTIRSFLDGESSKLFGSQPTGDPDYFEAMDELEDFLDSGRPSWKKEKVTPAIPESLRTAFKELGVPFGSNEAVCKEAYKQGLKRHHPDRHANHAGNMQKATEKTARLNEAWSSIEAWNRKKSAN